MLPWGNGWKIFKNRSQVRLGYEAYAPLLLLHVVEIFLLNFSDFYFTIIIVDLRRKNNVNSF